MHQNTFSAAATYIYRTSTAAAAVAIMQNVRSQNLPNFAGCVCVCVYACA